MFRQLYQRIQCLLNKHLDICFTSYPIESGQLRVVRCLNCHKLLDVVVMPKFDAKDRLEATLSTIPGYPQERFR